MDRGDLMRLRGLCDMIGHHIHCIYRVRLSEKIWIEVDSALVASQRQQPQLQPPCTLGIQVTPSKVPS